MSMNYADAALLSIGQEPLVRICLFRLLTRRFHRARTVYCCQGWAQNCSLLNHICQWDSKESFSGIRLNIDRRCRFEDNISNLCLSFEPFKDHSKIHDNLFGCFRLQDSYLNGLFVDFPVFRKWLSRVLFIF